LFVGQANPISKISHKNLHENSYEKFLIGKPDIQYVPVTLKFLDVTGQKFAMLEMKNLLSTVLRYYRLESLNPEHHYNVMPDIILRPKFGLQTRIHLRDKLP
jgi:hypothetical protein